MTRARVGGFAGVAAAVFVLAVTGNGEAAPSAAPDRAGLDRYCVTCHNDKLKTSGLSLQSLDMNDVAAHPAVWEKVLGKLRTGSMPPPGRPRPADADTAPVVDWL